MLMQPRARRLRMTRQATLNLIHLPRGRQGLLLRRPHRIVPLRRLAHMRHILVVVQNGLGMEIELGLIDRFLAGFVASRGPVF